MDQRYDELNVWLHKDLGYQDYALAPASSDASFRRYFRVTGAGPSQIVMDAPPDKEDSRPYVTIAHAFAGLGLNVPHVLRADFARGFLLLTDLGSHHYLQVLKEETVERLYGDALAALRRLQAAPLHRIPLPDYDHVLLMREMGFFRDWFLERHLGISLALADKILHPLFEMLAAQALEQPRVWVHRDYHSRNLMVTPEFNPGVLDFQDAVVGPLTYDPVSLLKDCYIRWLPARVEAWALAHLAALHDEGRFIDVNAKQFLHWFDLMGVQRHLKAIGIFARLNYRDGKPGYLPDIPRTLGYIMETSARHSALLPLRRLLLEEVVHKVPPLLD